MNSYKKIILLSTLQFIVQSVYGQDDTDKRAQNPMEISQVMTMQHADDQSFSNKIKKYHDILIKLGVCRSQAEKIDFLKTRSEVVTCASLLHKIQNEMETLTGDQEIALLQLFAIGQAPNVFNGIETVRDRKAAVAHLLSILVSLDQFYQSLGGVVGYHVKVLELIDAQTNIKADDCAYYAPPYYDIRKETAQIQENIIDGIRAHEHMSELYVVGGAGDRLDLHDQATGIALPAARLKFLGKSLLHNLICDLQARERLFYKIYNRQITTPILLMTSEEKNNDHEVLAILEEADWFSRPKDSFLRVVQPLTPVITVDGNWAMTQPLELIVKPGGHGVVWKLIHDQGGFEWLKKQKRQCMLVRQINNPLAGLDYGLLAPIGIGVKNKKGFGFASCERRPGAAEGVNVLLEHKDEKGYLQACTNIEYTDFARHAKSVSQELPANTNILFASIHAVESAQKALPIPGMLVNLKHEVAVWKDGKRVMIKGARLESTMQNIADAMTDRSEVPFSEQAKMPATTFVTLNSREKTISVTKKSYDGGSIFETPEGAFYDMVNENLKLLSSCGMEVASYNSPEEYMKWGPSPLFLYNPALGPLYSIIQQKIRGGSLAKNAELCLDIAELDFDNVRIDGSLLVMADNPLGLVQTDGAYRYSDACGKCRLHNVSVLNEGIDRSVQNVFWKDQIARKGMLKIILKGHSEFVAENISFSKPMEVVVPHGQRAYAKAADDGSIKIVFEDLLANTWAWKYVIQDGSKIQLLR